jgi:pimeloyl-ACP methyl ester carboxylesterase
VTGEPEQRRASEGRYPRLGVRVDEHTIEVAGAPIFYRTAPATGTPVLYLHSAPTSSDDWLAALERTGGIAPDLIGFGRSAKGGNLDYTLAGYESFLSSLLETVGVEQVQLVAHGWGAAIALGFCRSHPERVQRLVLCDAVPLLEGFRWPRFVRVLRTPGLGELIMGSISKRLLARFLRRGSVEADAWPEPRIDAVWEQFDQGTQRAILRLQRSLDERGLAAAGDGLEGLAVPTLIVWGELDPWLDPAFARAYAERLPAAELQLIAGAGHWPWFDRPEVIETIAAFVAPRA